MRVNKFMLEIGVKRKITSLLEPVYLSQQALEAKLMDLVNNTLAKLEQRVKHLEDDLYNNGTRDDRFARIEARLSKCDQRTKDVQLSCETNSMQLQQDFKEIRQTNDLNLAKIELMQTMVQDTKQFVSSYDSKVQGMISRVQGSLEEFMKTNAQNNKFVQEEQSTLR